jgi:proteic killer suppression protein
MILSWGNSTTRRFAETGKVRGFGGLDTDLAAEQLAMLDAASGLADLSPLKSAGLHKLKGKLSGYWALSINGPWRLCFRFRDGNAHDVMIVDYHRG